MLEALRMGYARGERVRRGRILSQISLIWALGERIIKGAEPIERGPARGSKIGATNPWNYGHLGGGGGTKRQCHCGSLYASTKTIKDLLEKKRGHRSLSLKTWGEGDFNLQKQNSNR